MTVPQAFQIAIQQHQAGRLADAEALYRQILAAQPNHSDALHLLGVIAHQTGRYDTAVEWIRQSAILNPDNPFAQSNLGEAYRMGGRLDEAVAVCRRALEIKPDLPEAHNNLGNALRDQNQLDEAIAAYRRALGFRADFAEAHSNLGKALKSRGLLDEAIASYRRALELRPGDAEAHGNLGAALIGKSRFDEAVAACRRAIELKPDYAMAHHNLGAALAGQGQLDEAIASYRRALELQPDMPETWNDLGIALGERGQFGEAIAAYRHALALRPDYAEASFNLGNALTHYGQLEEAAALYRGVLELKPSDANAHNNLGLALAGRGELDEAVAEYRRAIQLDPGSTEALNNLGNALRDRGDIEDAITAYRHVIQFDPRHAVAHSNLIYTLHFHPGYDGRKIAAEQQRWDRQFAEPSGSARLPHSNDPSPDRILRIGYVSPDFREHVVGRNLLPLFQRHDRREFEILCYSGVVRPDHLTEEFRQLSQRWRSTAGVGHEALAELIRQDAVDILVDLSQHMAGNRLPLFARKPAPVQVSFAGYPESTGLEAIEYRISDRFLERDSADEEIGNKEHVRRLDSFWCYDPCGAEAEVHGLPAIESGRVTFGCLGHFGKTNERVLALWARVLGAVKGSRLLISSPAGSARERTLERLRSQGIEACRVEFVEFRPRREYLELYHRLDIVLDTYPYNGHNTSLDALWMGVPVVSLAGDAPVSRAGLSQLTNLGLPELVAHSETEFVNIAGSLAGDLPRLAELRSTLRERMENSVLMDAPRFARNVETAYRSMWKRWRPANR